MSNFILFLERKTMKMKHMVLYNCQVMTFPRLSSYIWSLVAILSLKKNLPWKNVLYFLKKCFSSISGNVISCLKIKKAFILQKMELSSPKNKKFKRELSELKKIHPEKIYYVSGNFLASGLQNLYFGEMEKKYKVSYTFWCKEEKFSKLKYFLIIIIKHFFSFIYFLFTQQFFFLSSERFCNVRNHIVTFFFFFRKILIFFTSFFFCSLSLFSW